MCLFCIWMHVMRSCSLNCQRATPLMYTAPAYCLFLLFFYQVCCFKLVSATWNEGFLVNWRNFLWLRIENELIELPFVLALTLLTLTMTLMFSCQWAVVLTHAYVKNQAQSLCFSKKVERKQMNWCDFIIFLVDTVDNYYYYNCKCCFVLFIGWFCLLIDSKKRSRESLQRSRDSSRKEPSLIRKLNHERSASEIVSSSWIIPVLLVRSYFNHFVGWK